MKAVWVGSVGLWAVIMNLLYIILYIILCKKKETSSPLSDWGNYASVQKSGSETLKTQFSRSSSLVRDDARYGLIFISQVFRQILWLRYDPRLVGRFFFASYYSLSLKRSWWSVTLVGASTKQTYFLTSWEQDLCLITYFTFIKKLQLPAIWILHLDISINCEALSPVMVLYNQALLPLKLKLFDSET